MFRSPRLSARRAPRAVPRLAQACGETCREAMSAADDDSPESEKPKDVRRVYLVEDHPLVREGLVRLFRQHPEFVVCGASAGAQGAVEDVARIQPDVALVAISVASGGGGLLLIQEIRRVSPATAVLAFSMHEEVTFGERALRAGAHGYVMKGHATKRLMTAIRAVSNGKLYFNDELNDG